MVFYASFNSISVISRRQLTLFMLSWVSAVREEREKEREFQLRMREIEMQERANQPKQKIEYNFDVTKHIRLVPPFQKKKMINTPYTLKKLQKT